MDGSPDSAGAPIDVLILLGAARDAAALSAVLTDLPAAWPGIVLISFSPGDTQLTEDMQRWTARPVHITGHGTILRPGPVYVSPPDALLEVRPGSVCALTPAGREPVTRPFDQLMASLAVTFGARTLTVHLAGTGPDGAVGARLLQSVGGVVLAHQSDDHLGSSGGADVTTLTLDGLRRAVTLILTTGSPPGATTDAQATDILERMGDAHCVLDHAFHFISVNAATERLLGMSRRELLGRSHWAAFPASVDAPVGHALRAAVHGRAEQHLTHHYTGEGHDLHLELDVYPTASGGAALFWRDVSGRVRADEALQRSERRYRALFNEMDEAYAVVEVLADNDGRWSDFLFLEVNPAFMRHTGMPDPVGRTATELLGTPNPRWTELYGQAVDTGRSVRVKESELTLGRTFDLNIFRLGGEGSRQVAVLFSDVTERMQAEALRREREARQAFLLRFSDALRAAPDADVMARTALTLTAEHLALDRCYLAAYQPEADWADVTHQVGNDRVPPLPAGIRLSACPAPLQVVFGETLRIDDVAEAAWLSGADRHTMTGLGMRAVIAATLRAGPHRPLWCVVGVSATPRRWTAAETALLEEIAERTWTTLEWRHAETARHLSEERLRSIFEVLPIGVGFVSPDGTVLLGNGELRRFLPTGLTPSRDPERQGRWAGDDVHGRRIKPQDFPDARALRGEKVVPGLEMRYFQDDDTEVWTRVAAVPLRDATGQITGQVHVVMDVNALKRAEETLQTLNADLEARVADRTRRLADLNAELASVITRTARNLRGPAEYFGRLLLPGRAEALLTELPHGFPQALETGLSQLQGVRYDLQALAHLENQALHRELISLGDLFAQIMDAARPKITWMRQPLPIVRADPILLKQAVEVLMSFTLSETRGAQYLDITSHAVQGEVWITVSDDGTGLTGEEASTLFDLTVRSEQQVPVLDGSGLLQVRRIMARHGGWAWAEPRRTGGKVVLAFPQDDAVTELDAFLRGQSEL